MLPLLVVQPFRPRQLGRRGTSVFPAAGKATTPRLSAIKIQGGAGGFFRRLDNREKNQRAEYF